MANAHVAPAALLIQNVLGRSRIWSGTNVVSVTYRQMLHSRLLSRICRLSNNRICPPSSDFSFRAGTNTDVRSGVPGSCDLSSTEISPQNMIISAGESRWCPRSYYDTMYRHCFDSSICVFMGNKHRLKGHILPHSTPHGRPSRGSL